ncbi:VanW family protein [Deinococcus altitudinis]|uniref:VanW family protein n=1 Tax=Deinococcus altitudinis TaxID=468914 RepID=UPI003891A255
MKRPAFALVISAFLAVALAQQTAPTPTDPAPVTAPAPTPEVPLPDLQPLPEPMPAPVPATPIEPAPAPSTPVQAAPVQAAPVPATPVPAVPVPAAPVRTYPPVQMQPNTVQPLPAPVAPTPSTTAPAQPAPVQPTPVPVPAPAPQTPAVGGTLTLVIDVPLKLLEDGQPVAGSDHQTFVVSAERTAALRRGGVVTGSLEADLQAFARKVSVKPQDARFEQFASGWTLVQRDGVTVDLDRSRASLLAALKNPASRTVALSFTTTAPARTLNYFTSKGVTSFLATGQTNYYGSSRARITNIHVGASKFSDRLFEGRTFSFNTMLGNISAATGFVPGLVIAGDRTATGVGGGICQVSTTVFRALYGAGLPIVERRNHSYQVHYYDPQGLDATIYQPSQDLKFANDTGGAVWFQTDWDDAHARLTVNVFGQPRDYTVNIGRPVTLSTKASPADRLISDPTMRAGQRRQVDWAAPGASLRVTRSFTRAGKVFKTDTLNSVYVPWPNIFMVGTRR